MGITDCGMCWLRVAVKKLVPLTLPQKWSAGRSRTSITSCARGESTFSLRSFGLELCLGTAAMASKSATANGILVVALLA